MTFIKNNLVPTLIIIVAAALIIVLALPLAGTEWAEGFRTTSEAGGETETFSDEPLSEELDNLSTILKVILPVFKVAIFMGVGVLLTALGRWLSKRFTRSKQKTI